MTRVVMLQFCAAIVVAVIAVAVGGQSAGVSALFGGLCYAIPNAVFALRLLIGTKKPGGATPGTFFIGEFLKILVTVVLMVAVVKWYHDINWIAFLAGFVVVLKSYFILLIKN